LARRLAKHEIWGTTATQMKESIRAFITPTLISVDPAKSFLIQHYALTFNSVDRFNRLIGYINYLPRVDTDFLLIVSLVQIAIIQTWALLENEQHDARELEEQGFDLQSFTVNLAKELLKK
jgi:hypothetical protein